MRHFLRAAAASVFAFAVACTDQGPTGRPAGIEIVAGASQSVVAGDVVPVTPSFVVRDAQGNALSGVAVAIAVTGGGGQLSATPEHADGPTRVGTWKLGTAVGLNQLTITVDGLPPATVDVTGIAGPPAAITRVAGITSAPAGTTTTAVQLRVTDQYGNGVSGQTATLAVTSGGGALASATAPADAAGVITVPAWTMGKSAVTQSVRATVGSVSTTVSLGIATDFNIEVRFFGPTMTTAQQALFTSAAARLSAIITGDLPGANAFGFDVAGACGMSGLPQLNETIDDIIIYASVRALDGPRGTLAQAGPCAFRDGVVGIIPAIGAMEFDVADLATLAGEGSLQDVIIHEMLHVLGIGTLWAEHGTLVGAGTSAVAYNGFQGTQGCRETSGAAVCATTVPVENSGGAGTVGGHWRETTFGRELMTGYVNAGGMPLSLITVGALADMGYVVNRDAADAYTVPSGSGASRNTVPVDAEPWERPLPRRGGVLPRGG
jgi:hypothetical protein